MKLVGQTRLGSQLYFVAQVTPEIRLMFIQESAQETESWALYNHVCDVSHPRNPWKKVPHYDQFRKLMFEDEVDRACDLAQAGLSVDDLREVDLAPEGTSSVRPAETPLYPRPRRRGRVAAAGRFRR